VARFFALLLAFIAVGATSAACSGSEETDSSDEASLYEEGFYDSNSADAEASAGECDPSYSGCVPDVPYDLDCADIGTSVEVLGSDPHGFDGDGDGYGCETYG
jgi:hypothetical protein